MTFITVTRGMKRKAIHVDQYRTHLTGSDDARWYFRNDESGAYAATVRNVGTGGHFRVRNSADTADIFTVGDSASTLGTDLTATSLGMTGGVLTTPRTHSPRLKVVEVGSSGTPLYTYTDWNPHTLYVLDSTTNPNKTAIYIESVATDNTTASGSEVAGTNSKRKRINTGIAIFHYSQKDNGGDVSGIAVTEWGNGNAGTFIRTQSTGAGARPVSISAPADAYSRTYGFAVESYSDGYGTTVDIQGRDSSVGLMLGVGHASTTTGDNSGTREYADGLRVYPYNGGVNVSTGVLTSDSGTATAGGSATLTDGGKAWTVNAWTGYVVRTTGGTGSGQERVIASNTGTVLTVISAWTTQPDATTTYEISTYQENRAALRVMGVTSGLSYYLNKYDTFRVMLDGKTTIATNRATSSTPGAAPAYVRLLGRTNTANNYSPEVQWGYQATDTGTTGSPSTEKVFAAIGGFLTDSSNNGSGGVTISTRRSSVDANLTTVISVAANGSTDFSYDVAFKRSGATLANGLNSNIALGTSSTTYIAIAGPTGAFSVGGFTGARDGRYLILKNATTQDMTIVNEDASSTAANRIETQTGANVTLTGISVATFIYDTNLSRWVLCGTQG